MPHVDADLLTALIDIVFTLLHLRLKPPTEDTWFLGDRSAAFGQDGNFVPRYLKLFHSFSNNLFVYAARVHIGSIPG